MAGDKTSLHSERTSRRVVLLSNDRVLRSVLTSAMGADAIAVVERPSDFETGSEAADVVVLDVPGAAVAEAVRELRRHFAGRLVVLADRRSPGFVMDDQIRVVDRPYTTSQLLQSIGAPSTEERTASRSAGGALGRDGQVSRDPARKGAAPLLTSSRAHAPRGAGSEAKRYRPHAHRNRVVIGATALVAVLGACAWALAGQTGRSGSGVARSVPLDCSIPVLRDKYWVDSRGVVARSPVGSVLDFGSAPASIGTLLFAPGGTSKWQRYRAILVVRHTEGAKERTGGLIVLARSADELRIGVSRDKVTVEGPSVPATTTAIDPAIVHEIEVTVKTDAAVVKVDGIPRLEHKLADGTSAGGIGLFSDTGAGAAPSFDLLRIEPLVTACTS